MTTKHIHLFVAAALVAGLVTPLWAQVVTPGGVDAGILLEQQRRSGPPAPPRAVEPGVLPNIPAPEPDKPSAAGEGAQTTVRNFSVEGNTLVDPTDVQATLAPWTGRPVSLADLRQAAAALEGLYRQAGRLARVSLPGQDITSGTVQLNVIQARVGRVVLQQGATPVSAALTERVQAMLDDALPTGQLLSVAALERALLIADDLPGVRVSGSLRAGDTLGSTDLVVVLRPSVSMRGEASLDNGGNRVIGSERATVQLNVLSPFGRGEQFNLGGSVSRGSQYVSLGASAPLPGTLGNQGWRVAGVASALRYQVLDTRNTTTGLPPEGSTTTLGANLQYPLVRTAVANWLFSAGYARNRLLNRDDNQTLGSLDIVSRALSDSLVLGVSGNQFDQWQGGGVNSASVALTTGHLSLDGSPATRIAGDARTVATQGGFTKLRWSASRLQKITSSLSLLGYATGQFASGNLDPSEKLYLGGMNGVRAYPNAEGGGSTGVQISLDLRFDLSPQWQVSAFYDRGQVDQYRRNRYPGTTTPLVANNSVSLQGTGLGISWRGDSGVLLKAIWARRIGRNPLATVTGTDTDGSLHKDRFWLNASVAF